MFGVMESILAISLFLWYRATIYPALHQCTPDLTPLSLAPRPPPVHPAMRCECVGGFVDPPSLHTTVYKFTSVSDCSALGDSLGVFHWVLVGLYSAGIFLAVFAGVLAIRRLHSSGVCGKSGVYAVTPERTTPVPDLAGSHQIYATVSPGHSVGVATSGGSHSVGILPGFTLNQR